MSNFYNIWENYLRNYEMNLPKKDYERSIRIVEDTVRLALHKLPNSPLTKRDFNKITSLEINLSATITLNGAHIRNTSNNLDLSVIDFFSNLKSIDFNGIIGSAESIINSADVFNISKRNLRYPEYWFNNFKNLEYLRFTDSELYWGIPIEKKIHEWKREG